MLCPRCQFENPEGIKFCGECGAKIEILCPNCSSLSPQNFKFCGECGHSFIVSSKPLPEELSFDEKLDKIQKYLPKGLTEKILAKRDRIEGERKQVTVMFCDMEGFTPLVEQQGAEIAYSLMDQVYEILIHRVHEYEGTVNEMTGDGIMALFGAPIAMEDAPQRAIRSAYGIHREMSRFSDKMKRENDNIPSFKMRIGIHTGPVVVGTLGNDLRVEFKAVGDTVNLASRMEGLAEPGSTYVTEDTFRLAEGLFQFEDLGEHAVKGRAGMVKAYRVIAPSTRRTKFDVSAERGLTPYVGRERELELLLDGFERAKTGRGQAFSVISEAGVGKTRLLYEFRKAVANEDVTFMEGKCLSYSRGVAYHPVIDIVKSNFEIVEGDGDLEIREKLQRGLKFLDTDETSTLPYLLELLSVKDSGVDPISISTDVIKDRIIGALNRITIKASQSRPVIMAIEDLHWIDKSSEDSLKALLESISGERIFLIFTYRPDYVHTWSVKSYYSQVNLNRLSNRKSLAMVTYLLGTEEIDKQLKGLILEKTEGVPFFIEEFIKSYNDLKIIEIKKTAYHLAKNLQEVNIPSTIQDVIMARVDSLPDGAKELLQLGSAIEREFSYELIKQVSGLSEKELLSRLSVIKDAELLFERGIYPQSTFIFKHAVTQEVVYESLLTAKKKGYHEDIGKGIEKLYNENIKDFYEVLSHHYFTAENYKNAAHYSKLSAKKAQKSASMFRAISFTQQRIDCLEKMPISEELQRRIIDARTGLGLYFVQWDQNEARKAIEPIIDSAIKLDYKRRLSQIYLILGTHEIMVKEDTNEACKMLEHALELAEETKDIVTSVISSYYYATALANNCKFERATEFFQKAYEINMAGESLWGASAMLSSLAWASLAPQGKIDQAIKTTERAIELAERSSDKFSMGTAYITHGSSFFNKGYFKEAETYFLKGLKFAKSIPFMWFGAAQIELGDVYREMGELIKSKEYYKKGISILAEKTLAPSYSVLGKLGLLRIMAIENEEDIDWEFLGLVPKLIKAKVYEGWFWRHLCDILVRIKDQHMHEAESCLKVSIEVNERNGTILPLGLSYASYAKLYKRKGDHFKAREYLHMAIKTLKDCGADGWVEKYEIELAEL